MGKKIIANSVLCLMIGLIVFGLSALSGFVISKLLKAVFNFDFQWYKIGTLFLISFVCIGTIDVFYRLVERSRD